MARPEWEYLELVAQFIDPNAGRLRGRTARTWRTRYGGEEFEGFVAVLNRAGEHGWELVSMLGRAPDGAFVSGGFDSVFGGQVGVPAVTMLLKRQRL